MAVFVLSANINSYEELTKLTPKVKEYMDIAPLPVGAVAITLK